MCRLAYITMLRVHREEEVMQTPVPSNSLKNSLGIGDILEVEWVLSG